MEGRLDSGNVRGSSLRLPTEKGDVTQHGYERMEIPGRTV